MNQQEESAGCVCQRTPEGGTTCAAPRSPVLLCSCVPALLGPAAGSAQSQRHKHLSIYTELTRVLPLLPLPAPSQRECHGPCLRKAPGNTNRHLLPNKALQSSFFLRHCTTIPTCRQEGCAVPSPHTMDTMEHSLDRLVLPAHTCCHLRWQQQRLSCALMRSIGLKSEKMLLKAKNTKMHWVCIFLTTDCSHLSLQQQNGKGITEKQQRPFPCT